jgi:hypothetical protein
MQIERREAESSLRSKGFVEERDRDHRFFFHEYNGKRTGPYAKTSHGIKGHKTCYDGILKRMKMTLKLTNTEELRDLLKCPMSGEQYNQILRQRGLLPQQNS